MRGALGGGGSRARQNAVRSGLVVLGAVAFGYLSFRVGFKPYLDRAQEAMDARASPASDARPPDHAGGEGDEDDVAASKDPAVVLRD
ncbi:uncharacterized protein LOC102719769 [Oryza brachyantha]|uniref:Uncharacterized protein n=1 Tax=Oryza brachyantha TaxID=4533 RepID=J3M959_ORYBR|nr:uncharacterized protein LOC102719769 [Oryza brachyantha]